MKKFSLIASLFIFVLFSGCKKSDIKEFFFPVEKDLQLGQQLSDHIASNPKEYPLLDSAKNSQLYQEVYKFRDLILASKEIEYKEEFKWRIKIINDPNTLNAFAAPGGFIYVYTGIIAYLDSASHFAGVMGHEIAHADRRHSINQMVKQWGVQTLLSVVLGDSSQLGAIASGLAGLKFSRADESDADEFSVKYLCGTKYEANGAAGFFAKLLKEENSASPPEFLSTHPSPDKRVEKINEKAIELGCLKSSGEIAKWADIQKLAAKPVL